MFFRSVNSWKSARTSGYPEIVSDPELRPLLREHFFTNFYVTQAVGLPSPIGEISNILGRPPLPHFLDNSFQGIDRKKTIL